MTDNSGSQPAGWYYAQGDPPGTHRYWDGMAWVGGPQPVATAPGMGQPGGYNAGPQLAGLGPRIGARVIDGLLPLIVTVPLSLAVVGTSMLGDTTGASIGFGSRIVLLVLSLAWAIFYEVFLNVQFGGTPGKLMLGLQIKKADGSALDYDSAFRRYAMWGGLAILGGILPLSMSWVNSLLTLGLVIAGMVMINSKPLQQAPWDQFGGTIVVRK
ncbi:MAG: RDD family protein [Acidimicrobiales bacterium]